MHNDIRHPLAQRPRQRRLTRATRTSKHQQHPPNLAPQFTPSHPFPSRRNGSIAGRRSLGGGTIRLKSLTHSSLLTTPATRLKSLTHSFLLTTPSNPLDLVWYDALRGTTPRNPVQ